MATVRELKATARPAGGKGAARSVRRTGRVPGVIYGDSKDPVSISLDAAELKQRIQAGHFLTTLYDLDVDGTKYRVIPRDFQVDPVRDHAVHVDFMRLGEGATIRVRIPIHVINVEQSPGVKRGGAVNIVTHALDVVCPADQIPAAIEVDVAGLEISHSKHLGDITLPPSVRPIRADATLVTIVPPSGYAEELKAAADAAAAAAAAAAAPAAGAAAPAAGAAPAGGAPAAGAAGGGAAAGGDKGGGKK
jgi:large subunit ribosomal protein L25